VLALIVKKLRMRTMKTSLVNSNLTADDRKKALGHAEKYAENAIAKAKEARETLTDEIKALEKGIKELDESIAEATEERKEENDFMAADTKANEILKFAKK